MKRRGQRLVRFFVALASVEIGWRLFDFAGDWAHGSYSVAQFLCFLFCVLGIQRITSAAVDMAIIAWSNGSRTPHGA
jgi:hypothetical protein